MEPGLSLLFALNIWPKFVEILVSYIQYLVIYLKGEKPLVWAREMAQAVRVLAMQASTSKFYPHYP